MYFKKRFLGNSKENLGQHFNQFFIESINWLWHCRLHNFASSSPVLHLGLIVGFGWFRAFGGFRFFSSRLFGSFGGFRFFSSRFFGSFGGFRFFSSWLFGSLDPIDLYKRLHRIYAKFCSIEFLQYKVANSAFGTLKTYFHATGLHLVYSVTPADKKLRALFFCVLFFC